MDRWEQTDEIIDHVEQTLLVILLSFMILIAFIQIILRNLFSTGLTWGDPLVRNLVLWVGFIGAAIATKEGKHITIDVALRWKPSLAKTLIEVITHLFSFFICGLLTVGAIKFIKNESQMGSLAFLGIPSWIPEIILPVTFGIMTFRYGLRCLESLPKIGRVDKTRAREGMT
ncbi:MAG: TRAP transporter small permease [Thermodesulfobacteriota bacterium]|jgi:TRAP-type C4-dicarboxylate transport system permease small subunit